LGQGKWKKKKAHGIGRLYISWDIIEQLIDVIFTGFTGPHWPLLSFTDFMTDVDIVESTRADVGLGSGVQGSGMRLNEPCICYGGPSKWV
jgi:hypothetical protein